MVLIETLWNVKSSPKRSTTRLLVLIETLWNVKAFMVDDAEKLEICFNRNIVECKGVRG